MRIAKMLLMLGIGFLAGFVAGRQQHPVGLEREEVASASLSKSGMLAQPEMDARGTETKISGDPTTRIERKPITLAELEKEVVRLERLAAGSEATGWELLLEQLKESDLANLATELLQNYPSATTDNAVDIIFFELGRRNPEKAWELLIGIKQPDLKTRLAPNVATAMAERSIEVALRMISRLPDSDFKTNMRRGVLTNLESRDPAKAFALEVEHAGARSDFLPNTSISEWVKRDADAATAAVLALRGHAAEVATHSLVSNLAIYQPQRAWELAQKLPRQGGFPENDLRFAALTSWAEADPQAAMAAVLKIEDGLVKTTTIDWIATQWAERDFAAAFSFMTNLRDTSIRSKALAAIAIAPSGQSRPAEMFAALRQYGPVGDVTLTSNLLQEWAKQDPASASAALSDMQPGPAKDVATTMLVRGCLSTHNGKAQDVLRWIASLSGENAQSSATEAAFEELARRDAPTASELLAQAPSASRTAAVRGLASGWSASDPEQAAAWAAQLPQDQKTAALSIAIEEWARRVPDRAAAFAQAHDSNGELVSSVVAEWLPHSPEQATAWVDKLPTGEVRDAGLARVAEIIGREDSGAAALWAQRISSASQREEQLRRVCDQWLSVDPVAAKAWIATSRLSAEAKQSLLAR